MEQAYYKFMIAALTQLSDSTSLSSTHSLTHTPSKGLSAASQEPGLELSILSWFEGRGIRKTNPEEVIQEVHSSQRLSLRSAPRKLSAPDELSQLGRRRAKAIPKEN